MIALGIDPDTKATGIAVVHVRTLTGPPCFKVLYVATAAVKASLPVQERIRHMSDNIDLELQNLPCYIGLVDPLEDLVTRIAVEGQRVYPSGKVRPQDLIHLAQVAGMAAAHAQQAFPMASLWIPEPVVWKGSVEKKAHQRRILRSVGLTEKLEGVEGAKGMTKTQRGHVVDAIGLALWVAQVPSRRTQR
jgi:hypothetical protein